MKSFVPYRAFSTRRHAQSFSLQLGRIVPYLCHHAQPFPPVSHSNTQSRSAKTVSKRKVKDLKQGQLPAIPLPVQEPDDAPQYPPLLQGVEDNMIKFDRCVVLTRVGNFYELYFEHAKEYGPLLGLKVATKSTAKGPVAMSGFPFWQLDRFLKILVQDLNKYVAISEEFPVPTPDKIKSGGLQYERKVARVVTPGTLVDENFLDPYQNNFLLAVEMDVKNEGGQQANVEDVGLAWLDVSTGDFFTQQTKYARLPAALMRIGPREILLSPSVTDDTKDEISVVVGHAHELITLHDAPSQFRTMAQWNSLLETPLPTSSDNLFSRHEKLAGHRLLDYVHTRLHDHQLRLRPPRRREENDILGIDRGSLKGLEILNTAKDGLGKGSLFHAVRRTITKGGSRLLRDRLTNPSTSLHEINSRLELVTQFMNLEHLREAIIQCLKRTFDTKRLIQKFAVNKGDADDMLCLARAISETEKIYHLLHSARDGTTGCEDRNPIQAVLDDMTLTEPTELSQRILEAIDEEGLNEKHRMEEDDDLEVADLVQESVMRSAPEEASAVTRKPKPKYRTSIAKAHFEENGDPWIMCKNASDYLRRLHDNLETLQDERAILQDRLRRDLNTAKLELKWTPGLGHVCHITSAKGADDKTVNRLNGRVVSTSKTTRSVYLPEWSQLGLRLAEARLHIRSEESQIFRQLRQGIIDNLVYLRRNAAILDELDVATGFALLALEQGWTRPKLNNGLAHRIIGGRHPTVKLGLEEQGRTFVSNDLLLDKHERLWLVTGPNMAGKSTFLRQNALITILAQVGSYVPAEYAEIGLVDQIFSRIGAADDLFRDQSTFMVEMLETAAILKHATPRSFVIMDEVGRGTTPEDGTAISFASLHHLYQINKCRTLFATHFHALIDMTSDWPEIGQYCTDVLEDESGSFTFVHKLKPGVNRQSHALKVAKMAGLPEVALKVAKSVQDQLMNQKHNVTNDNTAGQHQQQERISATAIG